MARGSIIKRGRRYYVGYYTPEKKRKWESGFERRKDAEARLREVLGDVAGGTYVEPSRDPFKAFAEAWLRDTAKVELKPATYAEYDSHVRTHLVPAFGAVELRRLSKAVIQAFVARKLEEGKLKPKSIRNVLVALHRMLRTAVEHGKLRHNPAAGVAKPRREHREMDYLDPEEVRRFLPAVDPDHRTLFLAAVMTGLRQGELLALQWGDLQDGRLHVRRSLYWASKGNGDGQPRWILQAPKSEKSSRKVDLAPAVERALKRHRLEGPASPEHDLIFCTAAGGPLDPKNLVRRQFHPALRRAKLRRIRFHDLRHTYAALQIAAGANPKYLQQQMGHASIQVTLDRYGHLYPDQQRVAAARLEAVVFGPPAEKRRAAAQRPQDRSPGSRIIPAQNWHAHHRR